MFTLTILNEECVYDLFEYHHIVSYTGISQRATASSLQSDLAGASKKLKMYYVEYGRYPTMGDPDPNSGTICPTEPEEDPSYCIKPTPGNTFDYDSPGPSYSTFTLDATNTVSDTTYNVTNDTIPTIGSSEPEEPSIPTVTIGTQIWMQNNMNVGTRLDGGVAQTDNDTLEKWCYDDMTENCTTYGGLYQWSEMMKYNPSEGSQGICPDNYHIPTKADWEILAIHVGGEENMYQGNSSTAGAELKTGGSTGFNALLGGTRWNVFLNLDVWGKYWTSTYDGVEEPSLYEYGPLYYTSVVVSYEQWLLGNGGDYFDTVNSVRCIQD